MRCQSRLSGSGKEWAAHGPPVVITLPARPVPRLAIPYAIGLLDAANGGGVHRNTLVTSLDSVYGERRVELPADHPAVVNGADAANVVALACPDRANPANATQVYGFEKCIRELWVPRRRRAGKSISEATIAKLVGSKVRRLVAHLGHDDMRTVMREDLEPYFDMKFEGATVGTIRDHIIQIKALFALAKDRVRIDENPAKSLWYSKENNNPGRPFLRSERNAIILAAWDCEDETVRWLWLLGCFYGPIAEFAEASLRDIVVEDGVPIIFLRHPAPQGRGKNDGKPLICGVGWRCIRRCARRSWRGSNGFG